MDIRDITNEPCFMLRASDPGSISALRLWAALNAERGGDISLSEKAIATADEMESWAIKHSVPIVEMPWSGFDSDSEFD